MYMYAVHICFDAYGALLNEEYNYLYYTNNQSISCKFIRTPIYFMKPRCHSIEHIEDFFGGIFLAIVHVYILNFKTRQYAISLILCYMYNLCCTTI